LRADRLLGETPRRLFREVDVQGSEAVASDGDWRPLVEGGAPRADEVRIVRLPLDGPSEADHFGMLSASERERAARFLFEIHRRRFVAARASLRRVLGLCLDRDPAGLVFDYTERGRPSLRLASHPDFDFNLAHSGDLALLAFSSRRVGVDVERLREMPNALAIARRFFSPREVAALKRLAEDARREGFFSAWTRKEALIKAVGTGLAGLKETEVSLAPDEIPAVLSAPGGAEAWQVFHLEPSPGFVGAVAVHAAPPPVRLTTWCWPRVG
jgi:4'-phosphopantetheinyl transferase